VVVTIPKDRAAAETELAKYLALKKKLIDAKVGAAALKKYDVEPFLKRQAAFENQLADFGRLRTQYNEQSDKLRKEKADAELPAQEVEDLEQAWLETGGKIQKLGSTGLKDVGAKLEKNLGDFDSTVEKLIASLRKVQTKTPQQRQYVVELLQFLLKTQTAVARAAQGQYGFVRGAIDAVKAKVPIK
jgi:dsDNA-specific endonuclease/ATPase MutS2